MLYRAEIVAALEITVKDKQRQRQRRPRKGAVIRALNTIQRKAAIVITGAMRTTAADTLNVHANLLPASHHLNLLFVKSAIRLATLPPTHPLH